MKHAWLFAVLWMAPAGWAVDSGRLSPAQLIGRVGFEQRPGARLPLDAPFTDESGRAVTLRSLLSGQPAVLAPVYYECPMLCTLTLNGLVRALRVLSLLPGRDFQVIAVSVNPLETPGLAREKKEAYVGVYGRSGSDGGWHFLVGHKGAVDALTRAVGFRYVYDPQARQYAHAPGLVLLTPDGRVSQYLPGIEFDAESLRLGLVRASVGRLGTVLDRAALLCYDYDPATGRYSLAIMRLLRFLGALTVAGIGAGVGWMLRSERKAS